MSDIKKLDGHFQKYRKERIKKECPLCSDLWHGFYEGCNYQKQELAKTQKALEVAKEAIEDIKSGNTLLATKFKTFEAQQKINEIMQGGEG